MILQLVQPRRTLGVLAVPLQLKSGKEQPGSPRFTRGLVPLVAPSRVCCIGKGVNFRGIWISAHGPLVTLAASWWHWRYDIVQPPVAVDDWQDSFFSSGAEKRFFTFFCYPSLVEEFPCSILTPSEPSANRSLAKHPTWKGVELEISINWKKQKAIPLISTKFTSVCNLLIPIAFRQTLYLYQMQVSWYFRWQVQLSSVHRLLINLILLNHWHFQEDYRRTCFVQCCK